METTDRDAIRKAMGDYINSRIRLITRLESKPNRRPEERVQVRALWDAVAKMCDAMEYMDKVFRPTCFD